MVMIKFLTLLCCIPVFIKPAINKQSPYLSVKVEMDSARLSYHNYKIEMKICEPVTKSKRGGWFEPDTSHINFDSLKTGEVNCDAFHENGYGYESLNGPAAKRFNAYEYVNQLFAWEKILVFKVSDYSSRGWHQEMYIVLPLKYKAFITTVSITDLVYREGSVVYLDGSSATRDGSKVKYSFSLRSQSSVSLKEQQPGWIF